MIRQTRVPWRQDPEDDDRPARPVSTCSAIAADRISLMVVWPTASKALHKRRDLGAMIFMSPSAVQPEARFVGLDVHGRYATVAG